MVRAGRGDGRKRTAIRIGDAVEIVEKANQRSGKRTTGIVSEILTASASHPYGIKVRLRSGAVGRVQAICGHDGSPEPGDPNNRHQCDDMR